MSQTKTPDRQMAESVAHFLYWSGYLDVESRLSRAVLVFDGHQSDIGTSTFRRLKESLDEHYPDWHTWNPNYQLTTEGHSDGE